MSDGIHEAIDVKEVTQLFLRHPGRWLLMEVTERNSNDTPKKLKLIASDEDKEKLRDYILEDENWDWSRRYLIVYADPNRPCDIA